MPVLLLLSIQLISNSICLDFYFLFLLLLFFKDFIYLFMIDTHRERQREKQAPCREPDVGLHPRSPGSLLGLKAGDQIDPILESMVGDVLLAQGSPHA